MKTEFLKKEGSSNLKLIFLGYGQDSNPFKSLKNECTDDLCLVFDYEDLCFDTDVIQSYKSIEVMAWSMGVMMAPLVLGAHDLLSKISYSLALNGTYEGIDETKGIKESMWQATSDALSDESVLKFFRRMCSDGASYEQYLSVRPDRSVESLKREMNTLLSVAREKDIIIFEYDVAIIGQKDRIFGPLCMKQSFKGSCTKVLEEPLSHFCFDKFREFVSIKR